MLRIIAVVSCAALVGTAGCSVHGSGGEEFDRLADNRRMWEQQQIEDYSYVLRRDCFCGPDVSTPVRIIVADGVRVSATYVDSGDAVPDELLQYFPAVPGLFELLEDALARADRVTVDYHATLGYPVEVTIDYEIYVSDDEMAIMATELTSH